jgi:O-antigen/teichoic acid export membrane protein
MLEEIKKITKHSSIYALGKVVNKLIGFILIPIYTNANYLSHSDYGALAVLEATSIFLIGILTMAMTFSLTRWYWDKKYASEQKSLFFTTLTFLVVMIVPIATLLVLSANYFSEVLFKSAEFAYLLRLTIVSSVIQIINNQVFCLSKLQSKSFRYSLMQITKFTISLGLVLWGVVIRKRGLEAIWEAALIAEIIVLTVQIPYVIKNSILSFNLKVLKEMISFGLPLMLASVSGVILATTDRYMLSSMSSLENTGVYSLGFKLANSLKTIISTSFALSLSPLRMQKIGDSDNKRFYSKTNTYTSFIFTIALLFLSLFSFEILKLVTKSTFYWDAHYIVPIIAFALLFGLLKDNITIGLEIKKKTKIMGGLIFGISVLNIGLNLLLIPALDIYGAALATLFSQFSFLLMVNFYAQRAYVIPYEWKKIIQMILIAVLIVLFGLFTHKLVWWIRIFIKAGLFISFPYMLYLFSFYESVELEKISKIFKMINDPKNIRKNIKGLMRNS